RRLNELVKACDEVRKGNLQCRIRVGGSDEVGELGNALDSMVCTIREKVELLERTKERLQVVMDSTPNGVVMLDSTFRVLMVNRMAAYMLGVKEEQVQGLTFHESIRNWDLWRIVERASMEHETAKGNVDLFYPNKLSVDVAVVPFGEQCPGYLIVMHDVTESARAERMKTDFVANVSHELKTPVTSIKGFAETLLSGDFGAAKVCEFAKVIYSEAERLAKIIDDLLELSKLEAGVVKLKPTEIDVNSLVESVRKLIEPMASRAGLKLETKVSPGVFRSDSDLIRNVLLNLLDNAIKYTESGGTVGIEAEIEPREARFSVCDTGIGIPKDELPRIFERFYRVDKARSRELGGTGLGLSIAKHQAELLGGEIRVESELGKGSRFTLVIPIGATDTARSDGEL
ncbi:MAG TPA: HAMP domain-containing protein, partial [Firmicutes bacterium]|nr:HAMP domain-containing protein [Bacillota bacterium]